MAIGSIVPGIGTAIGGAVGGAIGARLGDKATDKAGETDSNQTFTDKVKSRGKAAAEAGAAYAQANRQAQQRMADQNMQMAEKAKAGSQINTGEAMDMSWRLLKDMYFTPQFQTPEYAQARQRIIDQAIENMQRQQYFGEQQHGKIRAGMVEGLTPNERNEYKDEDDRYIEPRHPIDYMYDQEHSDPKKFPGMYNIPAHQMLNAAGNFVNFSDLPDWRENQKMRAIVPNLFERRKDGSQSKRLENYTPVLQDAFNQPSLRSTLSEDMKKVKEGAVTVSPHSFMQRNLNRKDDMLAITQQKLQQEREEREKRRLEARAAEEEEKKKKIATILEEKQQGQKDERNRKAANTRAANKERGIEEEKQKIQLSAEETKQERSGFLDTDEGKEIAAKFSNFMGQPGMYMYDGKELSPQRRRTLPIMEQAVFNQLVKRGILKSSPMDLAWLMLKGELQLPHQITEALRGDLSTLDRAHKMTDTNEGTLIENIHPDMENVVKLLAEKHLGDMTPTMQRPIMPLFHAPFL
ncbi:MAG: hypothetical protein ACO23H_06170 [Alphaproteobacteria bacterium]